MTRSYNSKKKDEKLIRWDEAGRPIIPDNPIIPYIEGDGIGADIWHSAQPVFDAAVEAAYKGRKQILWKELLAGDKACSQHSDQNRLPQETLDEISRHGIAIKGPLTTPVGAGFRSLNVAIRQALDLYACVRPVRHLPDVPSPMVHPERVDIIIFRENTEDVYAGLEWEAGSSDAMDIIECINSKTESTGRGPLSPESAVGIKPMSRKNTIRLVRRAINYAVEEGLSSVTLVHKGNIMKFTEGAFRDCGYQVATDEFSDVTITEQELYEKFDGRRPENRIIIKDRIADAMFQQLLLRPEEYDVIATPNLNGDYLSDAAAAQVGGLGMAPGANIGDRCALFEATHGSAPKYAGLNRVNPSSLILSGVMMLRFMGWGRAAEIVVSALTETISKGIVTYDLARQMKGSKEVTCSQFGKAIINEIDSL